MNTRNFVKCIATAVTLGTLALSSHAENFNAHLIGMRVVSKTRKPGTASIYNYVLEAKVYTTHTSVESKLGGVGAVPVRVAVSPPTYTVSYESPAGKTWQFKAKLNGTRVAERNTVVN